MSVCDRRRWRESFGCLLWLPVAAVVVGLVAGSVRLLGVDRTRRCLTWSCPRSGGGAGCAETVRRAVAAAGRVLRVRCLSQSLAAWWILRWRGGDASVRIGVRRGPEDLAAHAWLEQGGRPVGEAGRPEAVFSAFESPLL